MDKPCDYCEANEHCILACQPGSMLCMVNRLRYGGTHADELRREKDVKFCQYCGRRLRAIDSKKFCNNPNCINRYEDV